MQKATRGGAPACAQQAGEIWQAYLPTDYERNMPGTQPPPGAEALLETLAAQGAELAIGKALQHGRGSGLIRHCRHFGRIGAYTELAAARDCIGVAACTSGREGHWVAPFGGRQGRMGTNPISFAAPTGANPIVMDYSTAIAPEGKVRLHRDTGQALPEPWLLNADGQPSTDPPDL